MAWLFHHPRSKIDLSHMTVRPLASQPGLEDNPSISSEGLWISCLYRAHPVDRPQLQVRSTQGGPPVVIEIDGLVVQGPAAWSPDSNELAFAVRKGSREHSIYRVRRTGGAPKRIVECGLRTDGSCEMDWSPVPASRRGGLCALEEPAQNGRSVKRATQITGEFLYCLAARSRALWAFVKFSFSMVVSTSRFRLSRCEDIAVLVA